MKNKILDGFYEGREGPKKHQAPENIEDSSWEIVRPLLEQIEPIKELSPEEEEAAITMLEEQGKPLIKSVNSVDTRQIENFVDTPLGQKIGTEREKDFRTVGEGTGQPLDLDALNNHYHQLVYHRGDTWGGYRYAFGKELLDPEKGPGIEKSYNASLFNLSEDFQNNIMKRGLELTRMYGGRMALLLSFAALHKLAIERAEEDADFETMFGSITVPSKTPKRLQNLLIHFVQNELPPATHVNFEDKDVTAKNPENEVNLSQEEKERFSKLFASARSLDEKISILRKQFEDQGETFPQLFEIYPKLVKEGYIQFGCAVRNPKRSADEKKVNLENPSLEIAMVLNLRGITPEQDQRFQRLSQGNVSLQEVLTKNHPETS